MATIPVKVAEYVPLVLSVVEPMLPVLTPLLALSVLVLGGFGMAYSLYPYVLLDQLTVWQVASAPESLKIILVGTAISLPAIAGYTVFVYRVFGGKTSELSYG